MRHQEHHVPLLLWPFWAIFKLVTIIIELTGRLVGMILGVVFIIVGAILGIPLALFGLMLIFRCLF